MLVIRTLEGYMSNLIIRSLAPQVYQTVFSGSSKLIKREKSQYIFTVLTHSNTNNMSIQT